MFFWNRLAAKCYVSLSDFSHGSTPEDRFSICKWFTRGWTLQELLHRGSSLSTITSGERPAVRFSFAMSYQALRQSRRKPYWMILYWPSRQFRRKCHRRPRASQVASKNTAYYLLGIFDVSMPLFYEERHCALFQIGDCRAS
ncbi:hypothetical protein OIDMADRAFT_165850 [Oidiodendron maius Zn]|uniref:Heterokaryon incompatibility domain-containing protein n=1 Tax=Oidiodendron maius (strain Zn) TaxID=913774 RepID=A0A0C3HBI7_OIDMZ|nr:hypothetical protein OIDMADRAFT_165850 [Oidiodendron maius Zn]